MTTNEAERKLDEFDAIIAVLNKYAPREPPYIEAKNKLLINVKKYLQGERKN